MLFADMSSPWAMKENNKTDNRERKQPTLCLGRGATQINRGVEAKPLRDNGVWLCCPGLSILGGL